MPFKQHSQIVTQRQQDNSPLKTSDFKEKMHENLGYLINMLAELREMNQHFKELIELSLEPLEDIDEEDDQEEDEIVSQPISKSKKLPSTQKAIEQKAPAKKSKKIKKDE